MQKPGNRKELMPVEKKISTRGRKREAVRWIEETNRRWYFVLFGDGPPRAGTDQYGRTLTERCDEGSVTWERESQELEARDPALYAAVMEILWAEAMRRAALTPEQYRADGRRRWAKHRRERLRARRQAE